MCALLFKSCLSTNARGNRQSGFSFTFSQFVLEINVQVLCDKWRQDLAERRPGTRLAGNKVALSPQDPVHLMGHVSTKGQNCRTSWNINIYSVNSALNNRRVPSFHGSRTSLPQSGRHGPARVLRIAQLKGHPVQIAHTLCCMVVTAANSTSR